MCVRVCVCVCVFVSSLLLVFIQADHLFLTALPQLTQQLLVGAPVTGSQWSEGSTRPNTSQEHTGLLRGPASRLPSTVCTN